MKHPPIDPDFFAMGIESGMSEEDIQIDWDAYCDDLEKFHADLETAMGEIPPEKKEILNQELVKIQEELNASPLPVQYGMQPLFDEIKKLLEPKQ